ncbi:MULTISPECIES: SUKH-3 domain-containing protein [unclassified Streptomyces]|uniref:SUKH-3 domain-containing protein n=1 Tax=unclassified Streptomyces TaxID=2593676 RepID=UPI0033FD15F9
MPGEPFELDPELAWGEEGRFLEWSDVLGRELFPLGEVGGSRFFLGIGENSEIYLVETWVASFGVMPHALENLILGVVLRQIDDGHGRPDRAPCRFARGPDGLPPRSLPWPRRGLSDAHAGGGDRNLTASSQIAALEHEPATRPRL